MVDLNNIKNIYLYNDVVSFKCGIDMLTNLILTQFSTEQCKNSLFVFFSKRKNQLKAIEFDNDGIWLYQKKLTEGNFVLPSIEGDKIQIDKKQLISILNLLKFSKKSLKKCK